MADEDTDPDPAHVETVQEGVRLRVMRQNRQEREEGGKGGRLGFVFSKLSSLWVLIYFTCLLYLVSLLSMKRKGGEGEGSRERQPILEVLRIWTV